ncbi:MAG: cobalamin-binding protein [Gammaproteobacteria bacterium]
MHPARAKRPARHAARRIFAAALAASLAAPAHSGAISVTDDFDRVVALAAPAARIISLSPHTTENLFAAGAGGKVVGAVPPSDYPPEAARIAPIGSHSRVNIEAAIALAPDLVVAWQTEHNRAALGKIAQLGFPVYYSEPRNFEDIIENIEELALLAGSDASIKPARLRAELASVRAAYAAKPVQRVFYQVWSQPLITLNGEHLISRALEICGARNIFAHLPVIAPRLSREAVIGANPDIIIGGRRADMSMWAKWKSVKAVARGDFLRVDADVMHRHTARMILGLRGLCERIDRVRRANHQSPAQP